MEAFFKHYDCDAEWHIKPEDAPKEIELMRKRTEEYPQGKDACEKFMKKCQKKGWPFIIKVKRTKPAVYYIEIDTDAGALSHDELCVFFKHYDCDAEWHIKPEEAPKEIDLMRQRTEEYPQGKDACARFMKKCQKKGWPFVVKVKRTKPAVYYIEIDSTANVLSDAERDSFYKVHECDAEWHIKPEEAPKEIDLMRKRTEEYPQGKDACARFMGRCQKKGWPFIIKVKRTKPAVYYVEIDRTQIFNTWGLSAFYQHYDCDAEWHIKPEEAKKEIALMRQRSEDYPQGKDACAKFMKRCRKIGQPFVVKVKRSKPAVYYLEVDK